MILYPVPQLFAQTVAVCCLKAISSERRHLSHGYLCLCSYLHVTMAMIAMMLRYPIYIYMYDTPTHDPLSDLRHRVE